MQTPTMVQYTTAPKSNRGSRLGRGSSSTSTMEQYGYSQPAANITVSPSFSNIGNPNVSVGNIGGGGSPSVTPPPVTPPPVTPPPVTPPPVTPPAAFLESYSPPRRPASPPGGPGQLIVDGMIIRGPNAGQPANARTTDASNIMLQQAIASQARQMAAKAAKAAPVAPPAAPAQAKAKAKAKISSFSTRMPKATSRPAKKKK